MGLGPILACPYNRLVGLGTSRQPYRAPLATWASDLQAPHPLGAVGQA